MSLPVGIWATTSPVTSEQVAAMRPWLEKAAERGWPELILDWTTWKWQPMQDDPTTNPVDPEEGN